jgi:hypothetical protein
VQVLRRVLVLVQPLCDTGLRRPTLNPTPSPTPMALALDLSGHGLQIMIFCVSLVVDKNGVRDNTVANKRHQVCVS